LLEISFIFLKVLSLVNIEADRFNLGLMVAFFKGQIIQIWPFEAVCLKENNLDIWQFFLAFYECWRK